MGWGMSDYHTKCLLKAMDKTLKEKDADNQELRDILDLKDGEIAELKTVNSKIIPTYLKKIEKLNAEIAELNLVARSSN